MYWEGGFQMIKLREGTGNLYLEHTTLQPKSGSEEKL